MSEKIGRYKIIDELGQGGFAIVYRAYDTELDRYVALKELRPILLQDREWIERFRLEAKTVARLDHAHIVTIYDVFETESRLFLVIRLVNGPTLDRLIIKRQRINWADTVTSMQGIAAGLDYAHSQGVLHRDLKPANVMIDADRGPMLTDFGLAKLTTENSTSVSGTVVGTPHYIAPEIWEGQKSDKRADIYALGCIIFEMVTGRRLFDGTSPPSVMMAHFKPPELPDSWPEDVPPELTEVLRKTLATSPHDRFNTATELTEALNLLTERSVIKPQPFSEPPPHSAKTPTSPEQPPSAKTPSSDELVISHQALQERVRQLERNLSTPASPMPTSPPQKEEEADSPPQKRWRGGCFWMSILGGILFMLTAVLSLGVVCTSLEGITTNLATISSNFVPDLKISDQSTMPISMALPETITEPIPLRLQFDTGTLKLRPGATKLISGTAQYNLSQLQPRVFVDDHNVYHVQHEAGLGLAGILASPSLFNQWELQLATVPLDLTINIDASDGDFDLGQLALQNLTINQKFGQLNLMFGHPNQQVMETLTYNGTTGDAVFTELGNSQARDMQFDTTAGNYSFNFSGAMQQNVNVNITGALGSVRIIIPKNRRADLTISGNEDNVNFLGQWQQTSKRRYINPGADGPLITLQVGLESGTLRLRN